MSVQVKKIPGGTSFDGILLKSAKCGCTSLVKCCYSWSKLKKRGTDTYEFKVKATAPDTIENFNWGYKVQKDGLVITVEVEDAVDKEIFSGYMPPPSRTWADAGWEVISSDGEKDMKPIYRCGNSKWLYDEARQDVKFNGLPDSWKCPKCGSSKSGFEQIV